MEESAPRIVLFTCQNCPAQARDRLNYMKQKNPLSEMSSVILPCLARLDVRHMLEAIERGADAVFIIGCSDRSCLYKDGVELGRKRINYVKQILQQVGIEEERVQMIQASSSRAIQFAEIISDAVEVVRKLGPTFLVPNQHGWNKCSVATPVNENRHCNP